MQAQAEGENPPFYTLLPGFLNAKALCHGITAEKDMRLTAHGLEDHAEVVAPGRKSFRGCKRSEASPMGRAAAFV